MLMFKLMEIFYKQTFSRFGNSRVSRKSLYFIKKITKKNT